MKNRFVVIFVTCGSRAEARKIVEALVRKRLIACANIISGVESIFWWKGKVDRAREALVIAKTKAAHFRKVEQAVRRLHGYDVPEIIALPIAAGSKPYLEWLDDALRRPGASWRRASLR